MANNCGGEYKIITSWKTLMSIYYFLSTGVVFRISVYTSVQVEVVDGRPSVICDFNALISYIR